MTVKELKEILNDFNDDEVVIGEVAAGNCGGHGMYFDTTSAQLVSITSKERKELKSLEENIEFWEEKLLEIPPNSTRYNIPNIKKGIKKDKERMKKILDKLNKV